MSNWSDVKPLTLPIVFETTAQPGNSATAELARVLGVLLMLVCTVHYAYPRTSVLGAVLLTEYFGGAVATHDRVGSLFFAQVFFSGYVGVLMWLGHYLPEPRMQVLSPLRL